MASDDSVQKTLIVATLLCIVCSILVSSAAVFLRPLQEENKKMDIKKSLLLSAGLLKDPQAPKEEILDTFKQIEAKIIDLETGDVVLNVPVESFNQRAAAKDSAHNKMIKKQDDLAGISMRSKRAKVYFAKEDGEVNLIILPIHGKGLWSTLYGFLALAPDTKTIKGFGFYEHGETPGLGGEVDNAKWKASWKDKTVYNESFEPILDVVKGRIRPGSSDAYHQIDGLSGATLTSNGVENLVQYWLGKDGFGPFLAKFRGGAR
ncbi:MAG: Na(+)-translocating NADH-quinone reductase subunit C [Bacteriovoracaceae bacterium]|nr:Na(+)-translocating NADH-quinone reductase subunit C [Bacteriovoracaceae bacterium]